MNFLRCPCTSDAIKRRSVSLRCNSTMPYHCMIDNKGESIEKCEEKTWIEPGLCAVYIADARLVDSWECRGDLGICPESRHFSNEALLYSACLNRGLVLPKVLAEKKDTNETFTHFDVDVYLSWPRGNPQLEKCYSAIVVRLCPSTTYDIRSRAVLLGCNETLTYHCMSDREGNIREMCFGKTWIQKGRCAVYDRSAQTVDAFNCSGNLGICPEKDYFTNDVILYSACISGRMTFSTTSTEREVTTETSTFGKNSAHAAAMILSCPLRMAHVLKLEPELILLRCTEKFHNIVIVKRLYIVSEKIGTCSVRSSIIKDASYVNEFEIGFPYIEECRNMSSQCLRDQLIERFYSNQIMIDRYTAREETSKKNFNHWQCGLGVSTAVMNTVGTEGSLESSITMNTFLVVLVIFILLTVGIYVYIRIMATKGDWNTSEPSFTSVEMTSLEVWKSDEED